MYVSGLSRQCSKTLLRASFSSPPAPYPCIATRTCPRPLLPPLMIAQSPHLTPPQCLRDSSSRAHRQSPAETFSASSPRARPTQRRTSCRSRRAPLGRQSRSYARRVRRISRLCLLGLCTRISRSTPVGWALLSLRCTPSLGLPLTLPGQVHVRYGKPIDLHPRLRAIISSAPGSETERAVIKELTLSLSRALDALTITAPDWEAFYAGRAARDILFGGSERIPLARFFDISQAYASSKLSNKNTIRLKFVLQHH
jgi:hypothetical protein